MQEELREVEQGQNYAVVDIETTGSLRKGHRITEIAIFIFDGEKVIDSFTSLINPEVDIPYTITQLTGIDNSLVADAPKFYQVAKEIVEITEGCIFVAHNVFFDYNFIKHEFSSLGYNFSRKKLCTVRLARKYLPGHKSYSLGNVCKYLQIEISARHRAYGDAAATVELFKMILAKQPDLSTDWVEKKAQVIPARVDIEAYKSLPTTAGVYYFYDSDDVLLYVGKSKNIKSRVSNHFRPNLKKKDDLKIKDSVAKIKFKETGSDIVAQLLECQEIKDLKPLYNRALRRRKFPFSVYMDDSGKIHELKVRKTVEEDSGYLSFGSRKTAGAKIDVIYNALLGTDKDSILYNKKLRMLVKTVGVAAYNKMLDKTLRQNYPKKSTFSIKLNGRSPDEHAYVHLKENNLTSVQYVGAEGSEFLPLMSSADQKRLFFSFICQNDIDLIQATD